MGLVGSYSKLESCGLLLGYSVILGVLAKRLPRVGYFEFFLVILISGTLLCLGLAVGTAAFHIAGAALFFLVIERIFPRNKYRFSSSENVKNARYFLLRRAGGIFISYLIFLRFGHIWYDHSLHVRSLPFVVQGILVAVTFDFIEYLIHRIYHRSELLWRVHKVHHAVRELNFFAEGADHFVDYMLIRIPLFTILTLLSGANLQAVLYFSVIPSLLIASLFSHANLDFPKRNVFPLWAYVICTPNFHAHHHTQEGKNRNFGRIFSFWDLIFGTFEIPLETPRRFGIEDQRLMDLGIVGQQLDLFRVHSHQSPIYEDI